MTNTDFELLIQAIDTGGQNKAVEVRNVLEPLRAEVFKIGKIELFYYTNQYIIDNFDSTGLGINNETGNALCNGNNGTVDLRRRGAIGYDSTAYTSGYDYSLIGNQIGVENVTLTIPQIPSHGHETICTRIVAAGGAGVGTGSLSLIMENFPSTSKGGDKPHDNIQPSLILVYTQRVA